MYLDRVFETPFYLYIFKRKRNATFLYASSFFLIKNALSDYAISLNNTICLAYNIKIRTLWLMVAELQREF